MGDRAAAGTDLDNVEHRAPDRKAAGIATDPIGPVSYTHLDVYKRQGAAWADLEMPFAAEPGDRAAAGPDRLDVDHRDADGKCADRTAVGDVGLGAFDQAEIGGGAAGIERHQIGKARDLGDDGRAERARGRAGQRRRDRFAHHLLGAGDATARLHDQERPFLQVGAERVVHAIEVAHHVRLDEGIDQGRHRPLVFPVFRQHRAGERERALRIFLREDLADAPLVRGIGIGMHQAHAHGTDAVAAEGLRGATHARLVERPQLLAAEVQAAADLAHIAQRHDALGLHPEIRIAVAFRHRLPRDLQDVPEALRHDQPQRADLPLQQRVGGDRRAVGETRDVIR